MMTQKIDLHSTIDASVWAAEFCKLNTAADEGAMLGWFANAIMTGFDEANRRASMPGACAVSPAESVQSIDTPEFRKLATAFHDASYDTSPVRYAEMASFANTKVAAAHAEGRRSAMEELEAKIEAAARDKDGNHVDDLRGWLDEAREENEVQGVAFHACSLKLKQAEEELSKEKKRADRAEAECERLKELLCNEQEMLRKAIAAGNKVRLAAQQAPNLSKLVRYGLVDHPSKPTGIEAVESGRYVRFADVQALLSSTAQAEPVLWVESEPCARHLPLREIINSVCHTVMYHHKKPMTDNPVWPLYDRAAPPQHPDDRKLMKRQYDDWSALAHAAGFSSITAAMESLTSPPQQVE